jgi:hypothetical protein
VKRAAGSHALISPSEANYFRVWHFSEVATLTLDVRCRGDQKSAFGAVRTLATTGLFIALSQAPHQPSLVKCFSMTLHASSVSANVEKGDPPILIAPLPR